MLALAAASAARRKEIAEQRAALVRQEAAGHLGTPVQARLAQHVEHAAGGASLRVGSAVDDARHARPNDRARAHCAGLDRHVQHRIGDSPAAELGTRLAQHQHLRVCGGVGTKLALIAGGRKNLSISNEHRSDRHVALLACALGLAQRQAHVVLVAREEVSLPHGSVSLRPGKTISLPTSRPSALSGASSRRRSPARTLAANSPNEPRPPRSRRPLSISSRYQRAVRSIVSAAGRGAYPSSRLVLAEE